MKYLITGKERKVLSKALEKRGIPVVRGHCDVKKIEATIIELLDETAARKMAVENPDTWFELIVVSSKKKNNEKLTMDSGLENLAWSEYYPTEESVEFLIDELQENIPLFEMYEDVVKECVEHGILKSDGDGFVSAIIKDEEGMPIEKVTSADVFSGIIFNDESSRLMLLEMYLQERRAHGN